MSKYKGLTYRDTYIATVSGMRNGYCKQVWEGYFIGASSKKEALELVKNKIDKTAKYKITNKINGNTIYRYNTLRVPYKDVYEIISYRSNKLNIEKYNGEKYIIGRLETLPKNVTNNDLVKYNQKDKVVRVINIDINYIEVMLNDPDKYEESIKLLTKLSNKTLSGIVIIYKAREKSKVAKIKIKLKGYKLRNKVLGYVKKGDTQGIEKILQKKYNNTNDNSYNDANDDELITTNITLDKITVNGISEEYYNEKLNELLKGE